MPIKDESPMAPPPPAPPPASSSRFAASTAAASPLLRALASSCPAFLPPGPSPLAPSP